MSQDGVVGTDWPVRGSNPGRDNIFHTRPVRSCGPPTYTMDTGSFPEVKQRDVDHPHPSGAEVKDRVTAFVPSWQVVG